LEELAAPSSPNTDLEAAVLSEQLVTTYEATECHNLDDHKNLSFVSYFFPHFLKKTMFNIVEMTVHYLFIMDNMTEEDWECHFNFTSVLK
jgi:hypothetical protein